MTSRLAVSGGLMASLFASTALSQEAFVLEPIVVQALRAPIEAAAIPGTIEIIDGEDIVRDSGGDLGRYLGERVAGLTPDTGTISGASLNLRGRGVQVLVNGVPRVSELRGFSRDFATIDPASIDRVEVIKGATALYGNGATGGLINIVTRAAEEEGTRFFAHSRLSFQEEDFRGSLSHDLSLGGETRQGNFGLRIDLGASFTGDSYDGSGNRIPSDPLVGQGGGDDLESYSFTATADYQIGVHEFEVTGTFFDLEQDIDFFPDYTTDPVSVDFDAPYTGKPVEDRSGTLSASYRNESFALGTLAVTTFYSDSERRAAFVPFGPANPLVYYSGDPLDPQDPEAQTELFTTLYGLRATIETDTDIGLLTYGLDFRHDDIEQKLLDGRDVIAPMTQDSLAGFVQLDAPIGDRFDVRAGVRYEKFWLDVEDFTRPEVVNFNPLGLLPAVDVTGGNFDYDALVFNIGGVYHATDALDLFAGFSQGFSIPDVGAFTRRAMNANPLDPTPISFASIQPEAAIVNSYEIGARYTTANLRTEASVFLSTSEEGTTFDPATNEVTQQEERIWGAELSAEADVTPDLVAGAILSYVEGRYDEDQDGDIDSYLPNNRIVAPVTATLYAEYEVTPKLTIGGDLDFTSSRDRDPAFEIESTTRVNLQAEYELGAGIVTAGVTNLFDTDQLNPTATSVRNIPVADEGRRIWLGYGVRF